MFCQIKFALPHDRNRAVAVLQLTKRILFRDRGEVGVFVGAGFHHTMESYGSGFYFPFIISCATFLASLSVW